LGACLAEAGKKVLLIDLDPQANLTMSLAIQPESLEYTVAEVLIGSTPLLSVCRASGVSHLDIAPSNASLAVLERALYRRRRYETRLKQAASSLDDAVYDYVLIDCPPSLGPLTLNALTSSELVIVPTQAEYYALRSLQNIFQLVKLVRDKTNAGLRYRLLVTMYDRRNSICVQTLGLMRRRFASALFDVVIDVDTKLRECPMAGVPITVYKPGARSALQYRALAEELLCYE
jgi:chromosome partitioning protein